MSERKIINDNKYHVYDVVFIFIFGLFLVLSVLHSGKSTKKQNQPSKPLVVKDSVKAQDSLLNNIFLLEQRSHLQQDYINFLENQKSKIKYVYIEKKHDIDNASIQYLIDEFSVIFTEADTSRER